MLFERLIMLSILIQKHHYQPSISTQIVFNVLLGLLPSTYVILPITDLAYKTQLEVPLFCGRIHLWIINYLEFQPFLIMNFILVLILIIFVIILFKECIFGTDMNVRLYKFRRQSYLYMVSLQYVGFCFYFSNYLGILIIEFNAYLFFRKYTSAYQVLQILNIFVAIIVQIQCLILAPYAIKLGQSQNTQQGQFIRYFLQIIQLIVFLYSQGIELSQIIQSMCTILICFTYYTDIVYQKARDNKYLIITQYFTNSIGISLSCIQLCQLKTYSFYEYGILWVIMTPLLTYLQIIYSHQESNIFQILQLNKIHSFQQLRYVSTKLVYFKQVNDDQTQTLINNLHIQNCDRKKCLETKNQYNNIIKHLINVSQEQYYDYLCKDRQKTNIEDITLIYIQYLIESDQLSQAYLLLNQLNQKKQRNNLIVQREKSKLDQGNQLYNSDYKTTYKILSILQQNHFSLLFNTYIQIYILITKELIKRKTESQGLDLGFKKSVQRFIQNENNRQELNKQFQDIIDLKIKFLLDISSKSQVEKDLVNQILNLNHLINDFYQILINRYRQNQSYRNQNILLIFQIDVLTDYIGAYRVNEESTFDLEGLQNQFELYIQNSLNSKFYYISVSLIDCQRLNIRKYSKNLRQLYGSKLTNVTELLPNMLKQHHPKFVKQYLQYGKNKFQDQFNNAFLLLENQTLYPIQMSITRDQSEQNQLQFAVMIQSVQNLQNFMFVDQNEIIQEVSDAFCSLSANQIIKYLYQQKLSNIIENSKKYINQHDILHYDVNFYLVSNEHRSDIIESNHYQIDKFTQQYVCQLFVNKQQLTKSSHYYILYFEQIKKISTNKSKSISTNIKEQYNQIDDFNESVKFDYPISENAGQREIENNLQEYFAEQVQPNLTIDLQLNNPQVILSSRTNNDAKLIQDNQIIDMQFEGSQMSSIGGLRKSQFYKKFAMVDTLIQNKNQSTNVLIAYSIINLLLLVCFVYCLIFISTIMKINELSSDISLITIKNDIYEPFESFLVTRYTIVGYNTLLATQLINSTEHAYYVKFPQSNLVQAYDDTKNSIQSVLNRQEFQSFLVGNYMTIQMYQRTNLGQSTNMTFRSVLSLFLNYQYEYKLAYTIKSLERDGPYFYFSYINYFDIYNRIDVLGIYVLELTTERASNFTHNSLIRSIIFCIILLVLYLMVLQNNRKYNMEYNQYLLLVNQLDIQHINFEVKRLKLLSDNIKQDEDYLQQTKVIMQDKEYELAKLQKQFSTRQQECKIVVKTQLFVGYIMYSIIFVFIIILILSGELLYSQYLGKYQNTVKSFKYLSDVGVNIPTMYAQREVLYYRVGFLFTLTQQYYDQIYAQINTCVQSLKIFNTYFNEMDWQDTIYDQQIQNYIMNVMKNNLCDYLDTNYAVKAQNICNLTLLGTLQKGLGPTTVQMYQSLQTELITTNYTARPQPPKLELEGATLTANVILKINKLIKSSIQNYNDNVQQQYYVIYFQFYKITLVLFLIFLVFYSYALYKYQQWERDRFCNLKKIVYVFPQSSLLYDDALHRSVQSLTINL